MEELEVAEAVVEVVLAEMVNFPLKVFRIPWERPVVWVGWVVLAALELSVFRRWIGRL